MAQTLRLSFENLWAIIKILPEDAREKGVRWSFFLSTMILRAFLGDEWFDRYALPNNKRASFLTADTSDYANLQVSSFRLIDLAETLFNLQHIEGFDDCIQRMRQGDIEGTLAELNFGRLLYMNEIRFRYVQRSGVKGRDYDVEVAYPDGTIACADSKCKVVKTAFSSNTVRNVLHSARGQLPKDRPGIVFVKMPQHWMDLTEFKLIGDLREITTDFLRGTQRVVSIKYYVSTLDFENNGVRHKHGFIELNNPNNKFDPTRNWALFTKEFPPEWNGSG